jgi:hypothetical protein
MKEADLMMIRAGDQLVALGKRVTVRTLAHVLGWPCSTVHSRRRNLANRDLWPFEILDSSWSPGVNPRNSGNVGLCSHLAHHDRDRMEAEKREVERIRAEVLREGREHLRRDDRDDDPRGTRSFGFGHSDPILGGPTRYHQPFGWANYYDQDAGRYLDPVAACRIYIRQWKRIRRNAKQRVA